MPELPEVETVRRGLANRLKNFEVDRIEVCRTRAIASSGGAPEFVSGLGGSRVGEWSRRGKYLMASLEPDRGTWGVHLRMTGQFQWHDSCVVDCRTDIAEAWR